MLRRVICTGVLSALLTAGGLAVGRPLVAAPGGAARVTEAAGGFSYVPPPGWQVKPFPGLKYKIAYARPAAGFAPNLNFVDEQAPVPLSQYVRLSRVQLRHTFPGYKLVGQSAFITSAGLQGVKMVVLNSAAGHRLRQAFYLFPGHGSTKFVVTASSLEADGAKYDRTIDASMKTFAAP